MPDETTNLKTDDTDVVPTFRERQRRMREQSILEAAHELIGERGYDDMTMDELAARVGISKPTLYHHFPSKEQVVVLAVIRIIVRGCGYMDAMDKSLPAIEQLQNAYRHILEEKFVMRRSLFGAAKVVLVPMIREHPEYRVAFDGAVRRLSELVDQAKADGAIDTDMPTRLLVQLHFSPLRDSDYEEIMLNDGCTPEQIVNTIMTVLRRGMANPKLIENV